METSSLQLLVERSGNPVRVITLIGGVPLVVLAIDLAGISILAAATL